MDVKMLDYRRSLIYAEINLLTGVFALGMKKK